MNKSIDEPRRKTAVRPIAIDLFAGAGGLSLGFEQAGFDIVAAVEIDPVHCAIHKFNFPQTAIIPKSVTVLSGHEIRETAGIGTREVDCVFGAPPCQGFSMIGQRTIDDPRNNLVKEFVRIVSELDAKTFVFENVKGLTVGKHKEFLSELVEEFRTVGYQVRLKWKVLNAAHYGVPQSRERLILLGAKKNVPLPEYPSEISNNPSAKHKIIGLPDGPTCAEALDDLPDADLFPTLTNNDAVIGAILGKPSAYASELRCLTNDAWHFGYVRNWNPRVLTSSARTAHTDISKRRFSETAPGSVEPISRFFRLSPHGARQIGNSVPPPMARAIASAVLKALDITPFKPEKTLKLGDERLLTLEMSKAAELLGVKAPNHRRDRKSGAKKRKQTDIEEARILGLSANG